MQEEYKGSPIQIPVTKGTAKSTNHKGNVIDVLRFFQHMSAERSAKIQSTVTELSPNISEKDDRRKKLEAQVADCELLNAHQRLLLWFNAVQRR
jgi:hypothetical protein